jgi:hypothetical protein
LDPPRYPDLGLGFFFLRIDFGFYFGDGVPFFATRGFQPSEFWRLREGFLAKTTVSGPGFGELGE